MIRRCIISCIFVFLLSTTLTPPFDVFYVSSFYGGSYVTAMNGLMFFVKRSGGGTWISRSGTTFFYALNVSTGTQVWNYSADEWLTINFDNQRVYFGGNNGHLIAANQDDGSIFWRLNLTGAILANPAVENSTVYVGVTDVIYAISTFGEILWQKTIPSQPREDAKIAEGYSLPPEPGVHTEIISLLSQGNYLYGVITHEKTVVWGSDGNRPWARYASSDIFCVDLTSKEIRWLIPSPQYDKGLVGVSADFVYWGDEPIYALKASTGELLWNFTTGSEIHQITSDVVLIMNGDATYVNTTNGEII
jgi:outer membrane protein assembly factor BamB